MSLLLARIARTLTTHWIRGLLGALVVLIALIGVSAAAGPAADDFSTPGTQSQKAIDLFQAHQKELAGVDATVVFYAKNGKITDPANREVVTATLDKVKGASAREDGLGPVRRGRHDLTGRQARVRRRPLRDRPRARSSPRTGAR